LRPEASASQLLDRHLQGGLSREQVKSLMMMMMMMMIMMVIIVIHDSWSW